jgi:tRNA threonylcarbamoyladenosine biosynthesis protein TsaB
MPLILAIDTSTQACSCAINRDGAITEEFALIPRQHAQKLLPMISTMMQSLGLAYRDLDAVAFGCGPGSFTGLRIAAGAAQGIALGADLPVIGVSTLASQALQIFEQGQTGLIFSTLDARIDEVYWGNYLATAGGVSLSGKEGLCKPEALPNNLFKDDSPVIAVGSGLAYLARMPVSWRERIVHQAPDIHPRAGAIAALAMPMLSRGETQAPDDISPVYLRDKVTHS